MIQRRYSILIKCFLSLLFILCIFKFPYSFYELTRFFAMTGFALLALDSKKRKNEVLAIVFLSLALLFQPIFKIALGRFLWNIVDVIVAAFLIFSIGLSLKKK